MPRPSKRRREEARTGGSIPLRPAGGNRPATSTPSRTSSGTPSRYRTQKVAVQRPSWQRPWAWGGGATVVVLAVVVVFIALALLGSKPNGTSSSSSNPLAPASVLAAVTSVSPSVSSTIGAGGVADPLEAISGSPAALTGSSGKPEVFYLGAEFCPYCAAERWSVVIALSRFGKFSNLHITTSD